MNIRLNKWGNNLGLRIPKEIQQKYGLKPNSEVVLEEQENGFSLKVVRLDIESLENLINKTSDVEFGE